MKESIPKNKKQGILNSHVTRQPQCGKPWRLKNCKKTNSNNKNLMSVFFVLFVLLPEMVTHCTVESNALLC